MKHKRSLIALLLVLMLCFSLTACGSKDDSAPAGSAVAAESGGMNASITLVYAGENEDTINPLLTNHDEITDVIFSSLMKYDGNGKPVTDLATEYSYDEDTFTYVFTLRDGVKWHDGEPFTAEDVVFTYEELTQDDTLSSSLRSD